MLLNTRVDIKDVRADIAARRLKLVLRGNTILLKNAFSGNSVEIGILPEKKITTNGDRIRAMTDEELAEYLSGPFDEVADTLYWLKQHTVVDHG